MAWVDQPPRALSARVLAPDAAAMVPAKRRKSWQRTWRRPRAAQRHPTTCTTANYCGFNGVFSEYGTTTPWLAWVVPLNISDNQNDHFTDNTDTGRWMFEGFELGDKVTWTKWTGGFTDAASGDHVAAQDIGSTLNS